jgi:demethylmenaquinone methyltransferase/2-methoxy-6-polyprenyl-1,4-benzoquinol methylase
VLRPSGRLVVLEFSTPQGPVLSRLYRAYLHRLLPRLGDTASGASGYSDPYGYLARTIAAWPDAPGLAGRLREAGFAAVGWKLLAGGIVAVHTALKGDGA